MYRRLIAPALLALALSALAALPAQACAPTLQCAGPTCWYALLNDADFSMSSGCSDTWVFSGVSLTSNYSCGGTSPDDFAVFDATLDSVSQDFVVAGSLNSTAKIQASIFLSTYGSPSAWDFLQIRITDLTTGSAIYQSSVRQTANACQRVDFLKLTGAYGGHQMRITFTAQIVTSGVQYHLEGAQVFQD